MKVKSVTRKVGKYSYKTTEKMLDKSCDQMTVILKKVEKLEHRYKLAVKNQKMMIADNVKLQLHVLRGMYNMYYCYAEAKSKQLVVLNQQLVSDLYMTPSLQAEDLM